MSEGTRYRTLFLSDVHLGTRSCQAQALLDFLREHDAETIYLIGDIIDGWALKGGWYWPQTHNDVVQKLLRKGRKGARIVYLPGNHDEFLREYYGTHFGGIEVQETAIHETADGRRYLVLHGDQFDFVIRHARWLAHLGDVAYDAAIVLNRLASAVRRRLGLPYWSLSAWAKLKVKNAVNVISRFEDALIKEAARVEAQGVICGHIHHAVSRQMDGVHYLNTGDWVESCTAIVEHHDGRLEIIPWMTRLEEQRQRARRDAQVAKLFHASKPARIPEQLPKATPAREIAARAGGVPTGTEATSLSPTGPH